MQISWGPIERWPRDFTRLRTRSPFKATYGNTMALLDRELRMVSARAAVVQLALLPGEFRRDGLPYSDARPQHPGVIVSFDKGKVPLAFPCDAYVSWVENLRAVALALEALRKVDRYGVTKHAEQYRGWAKLPPPGGAVVTPPMSVEDAAVFIGNEGGPVPFRSLIDDPEHLRAAYRRAAAKLHPDANGGQHRPEWNLLQQAKVVLDAHHGAAVT